ncbi:craniofacial development protein 1 [Wyeomyia smithii]|uniref:craniofacial development protein 1 n=1 Tax=Wyeomyia smithii TaxID=174621 RepID=UPI002467E573|nr:craniofacial development protein 1 [Wyeomyia smithii]
MDPTNNYPSDSDESDEDFRPDKESDASGSEVDSDSLDINEQDENSSTKAVSSTAAKKRKRKSGHLGKKKKFQTSENIKNSLQEERKDLDEEEEKRKSDALWADFLAGTESSNSSSVSKETAATDPNKSSKSTVDTKQTENEEAITVTKVFEFAGEAVHVTEKVPSSKTEECSKLLPKAANATVSSNVKSGFPRPLLGRPATGGLGSVLSQIGKKNKLSTLEKSKLDWNSFKRTEGIEEELQTHNKGKDGYLEKQDFLERADLRQFEIEKTFRQTNRSKR